MHWQFGEMEFGEMKRNTSNWSNFGMLLRRAGLTASAALSCSHSCDAIEKKFFFVLETWKIGCLNKEPEN